ncbi:hypothetical protein DL89DRAFT_267760 [Linderina pennispora]|uniref:BHLH domain-containing protein n=1 Tax=Linderina pennispora TaxID=61395 RepID=A0A1Y1W865_9FUNG|nr:uncharacterized protein DL89DRAFT_267760 [Linderina pennispora]ORX69575.1 hypothetical protein DL89DRAFT_267760 [Linderina pennispora]
MSDPDTTAIQQTPSSDIDALSNFLSSTTGADPAVQAMIDVNVNGQTMAAFLASSAAGYPVEAQVPLEIASIGVTPSQSLQPPQFGDLPPSDAALAAAAAAGLSATHAASGMATTPLLSPIVSMQGHSPLLNTTTDIGSPMSHSFSGFNTSSLNTMFTAPQPSSYSSSSFGLNPPATSSGNFLLPPGARDMMNPQSSAGLLGKRTCEEAGLPSFPVGVPLSKRVSMPISYGQTSLHDGDTSPMPIPSSIGIQRIASYHPGTLSQVPRPGAFQPMANAHTPSAKIPISRLKSTPTSTSLPVQSTLPDGSVPTHHQRKVAHNAIERRYRNNINDRIRDLRNSVPALQHIRPKKKAGAHDDDNSDDEDDTHIDGVEAATKLNKATILGKATEYIYYLRRNNDQLKREAMYMQEIIRSLPNGENILIGLQQKAKAESAVASAHLHVPEKATAIVDRSASTRSSE